MNTGTEAQREVCPFRPQGQSLGAQAPTQVTVEPSTVSHSGPQPGGFTLPAATPATLPSLYSMPVTLALQVFRMKAIKLGEKLLPAFNTPTGIPKGVVNFKR